MWKVTSLFIISLACSSQAFSPSASLKRGMNQATYYNVRHGTTIRTYMSSMTDVEKLLAKARELREQAASDEHKLHSNLIEKKNCKNAEIDNVIQKLFPVTETPSPSTIKALAKRIQDQMISSSMLKKVVERLHEREIAARGLEHVESSTQDNKVKFTRVADPQQEELAKVQGLIQQLIDAAKLIDEEYLKKGETHHHVDATHWSSGNLSKLLKEKAQYLGREHEEQFKNRLEEYYEAARKKKKGRNSVGDSTSHIK
mmetsp:Transcript_9261/g.11692  ORF Transcript_9261/g.11692 Transcript_9261/m.11692 type:complete len:257 (-) Transcript_9261:163-933(-)